MLSSSFRIPTVSGIRPILASPTSIRCTLNRGCRLKFGGKDSLSSLFILCNFSGGSLQSSISTFSGKYFFSPSVNIFFRVYIYKFDRTDGRSLSRRVTTRAYLSSRLEACVEFGIHGRESDTFHRVGENGPTFPFGRRRLFTVLLHLEGTLLSRLHHQSKGIYPRNIKLRDLMLIKCLCRKMW